MIRAAVSLAQSVRASLSRGEPVPFIGVYDVFSATIAGQRFDNLFVSGYGFAASHYGLPDIGLIAWSDILEFVQRLHTVLPRHNLLVDIDDGYGDTEVACHVVGLLERAGAWGVIMEDQRRPRRCGHVDGKLLLDLPDYLEKLRAVLATRSELFVVARTDASTEEEQLRRAQAFAKAGADAVLVDGVRDVAVFKKLSAAIDKPLAFNQIAGGKSPPLPLASFAEAGVSLGIYSTPCLFAAQAAVEHTMQQLQDADGLLPALETSVTLEECSALLSTNLQRRYSR